MAFATRANGLPRPYRADSLMLLPLDWGVLDLFADFFYATKQLLIKFARIQCDFCSLKQNNYEYGIEPAPAHPSP